MNVRFTPMNIVQKWIAPLVALIVVIPVIRLIQ